jgi:hypothetical protein
MSCSEARQQTCIIRIVGSTDLGSNAVRAYGGAGWITGSADVVLSLSFKGLCVRSVVILACTYLHLFTPLSTSVHLHTFLCDNSHLAGARRNAELGMRSEKCNIWKIEKSVRVYFCMYAGILQYRVKPAQ